MAKELVERPAVIIRRILRIIRIPRDSLHHDIAWHEVDPKMTVTKACWVLDKIAKPSRWCTLYGEMLRSETEQVAAMEDALDARTLIAVAYARCLFAGFAILITLFWNHSCLRLHFYVFVHDREPHEILVTVNTNPVN